MLTTLAMNCGRRLDRSVQRACSMSKTDRMLTLSKLRVKFLCVVLLFFLG